MSKLLDVSSELLNGIFQEVDPEDLAGLARTCRQLNTFIKNNRLLWKYLYLRNYVRVHLSLGDP